MSFATQIKQNGYFSSSSPIVTAKHEPTCQNLSLHDIIREYGKLIKPLYFGEFQLAVGHKVWDLKYLL